MSNSVSPYLLSDLLDIATANVDAVAREFAPGPNGRYAAYSAKTTHGRLLHALSAMNAAISLVACTSSSPTPSSPTTTARGDRGDAPPRQHAADVDSYGPDSVDFTPNPQKDPYEQATPTPPEDWTAQSSEAFHRLADEA